MPSSFINSIPISNWFTLGEWYYGLMFILALILVGGVVAYLVTKSHKKINQVKEKKDVMKLYVLKELESKGITQNVSKEDIKKLRKKWKRINRDHRMTKTSSRLEKKYKEE